MKKKKVAKKTPTVHQKLDQISKAVSQSGTSIANCKFVGVQFDPDAVGAITEIARGLKENAVALGNLAETLNSNHVHIDSLVRVDK